MGPFKMRVHSICCDLSHPAIRSTLRPITLSVPPSGGVYLRRLLNVRHARLAAMHDGRLREITGRARRSVTYWNSSHIAVGHAADFITHCSRSHAMFPEHRAGVQSRSTEPEYRAGAQSRSTEPEYRAGVQSRSTEPEYSAGVQCRSTVPEYSAGVQCRDAGSQRTASQFCRL
jgi:hypothetical protein